MSALFEGIDISSLPDHLLTFFLAVISLHVLFFAYKIALQCLGDPIDEEDDEEYEKWRADEDNLHSGNDNFNVGYWKDDKWHHGSRWE